MANRILGIEYADDRIKIVEVGLGRRLRIFNFAVIDNRSVDPQRRAEQFNHTLQVRGFEAKEAVIASSGNVEHRLLTLPPLSTREMHFVMQRESKKLAPAGIAEMVWSYDVLKTKEELGIKKNQILLVTAERPMVDAAQQFFSQTRLKLLQVTTVPEAVLNLLRQVTAWKKDAVRTVVHFAGDLVHILFVQDGVLLLSREVRFDYGDSQQSDQVERITSELKRSTMYFRQNYPQAQLDQILFSGDNDVIGALSSRFQPAGAHRGKGGSVAKDTGHHGRQSASGKDAGQGTGGAQSHESCANGVRRSGCHSPLDRCVLLTREGKDRCRPPDAHSKGGYRRSEAATGHRNDGPEQQCRTKIGIPASGRAPRGLD